MNLIHLVNEPTLKYEKVTSEKIYVFNEWQQKRINIALKQVENGEYISEEEDEKEIAKMVRRRRKIDWTIYAILNKKM